MAVCRHLWPPFILLLLPLLISAASESDALLKLKESFENATLLNSWNHDSDPCDKKDQWVGVVCFKGAVSGLRLGRMGLSGKIDIDALLGLPELRTVSFTQNRFAGTLPRFNRIGVLKAIYLSGNLFSGAISADYFSNMASLKKAWLDGNRFEGTIPPSILKLPRLIELHLENNRFSGKIPRSIELPMLTSFNVSNNELEGSIPTSLSKFSSSAFAGNDGLCGLQVGKNCVRDADLSPAPGGVETEIPSLEENKKSAHVALICIVILFFVLLLVAVVRRNKQRNEGNISALSRTAREVEEDSATASRRESRHSVRKESSVGKRRTVPEITLVNEQRGNFRLSDLMKAAAEVLGTGGLGSAYKAVMASGVAVVVKRMRDMDRVGIEGFEVEMRRLGKLRHQNVLPLLAYHSRKEEKLLAYDFAQKGSLLYLLHGDRAQDHAELNWSTRMKIIAGIARGMAYLHSELSNSDLPHGNLRSSNVLLRADLEPMVGDYGFYSLVAPAQASQSLFAFRSPEYLQYNHVSPKSDVYCLGIVILEVLTGKFPSQYLTHGNGGTDVVEWVTTAESENRETQIYDPEIMGPDGPRVNMGRLLSLGVECTEADPARRPTMREAASKIEEIASEEAAGSSRHEFVGQLSIRDSRSERYGSGGPPVEGLEDISM